jgi:hypothetical protein
MAESLVSDLILKLGAVLAKELQQEVKMEANVEKAVKDLQTTLQSIQVLLADAERRQFKEQAIRLWLIKLKNTTYDVEDVLDDWSIFLQNTTHIENVPCIPSPCSGFRKLRWEQLLSFL